MTRKSFIRYAKGLVYDPQVVSRSLIHRSRIRAIRKFCRRPVILIERHAGIGDLIFTFPAVLGLRKQHPDAIFVYGVWKAFKSIVEMGQVADYVVEMDWSKDIPKVEHRDYDICYRLWNEDEQPRGRPQVHLVDDFCEALGVVPQSRQPKLYVPRSLARWAVKEMSSYRRNTRHIIGIHTGPSWPVREWTQAGWENLVRLLHQELDCTILQLGSDNHTAKGVFKTPRINGTIDCIDKFSLVETVAILEQLNTFIGIDSGLLHAAGAVQTPIVGLFGPVDPKLRLPPESPAKAITATVPCLGCHHRKPTLHWEDNCPNDITCMKSIDVAQVFKAVVELMQ